MGRVGRCGELEAGRRDAGKDYGTAVFGPTSPPLPDGAPCNTARWRCQRPRPSRSGAPVSTAARGASVGLRAPRGGPPHPVVRLARVERVQGQGDARRVGSRGVAQARGLLRAANRCESGASGRRLRARVGRRAALRALARGTRQSREASVVPPRRRLASAPTSTLTTGCRAPSSKAEATPRPVKTRVESNRRVRPDPIGVATEPPVSRSSARRRRVPGVLPIWGFGGSHRAAVKACVPWA